MYDFCKTLVKLLPLLLLQGASFDQPRTKAQEAISQFWIIYGKLGAVILVLNRILGGFFDVYSPDLFRDQSCIPFSLCFSRLMLLFLFCLLVDMIFK